MIFFLKRAGELGAVVLIDRKTGLKYNAESTASGETMTKLPRQKLNQSINSQISELHMHAAQKYTYLILAK